MSEIILSSTYFGNDTPTELEEVLIDAKTFDVDGFEVGSTHMNCSNPHALITKHIGDRKIFTHNYFPAPVEPFVLNIASQNGALRKRSVDFAVNALKFADQVDAIFYTLHPGFLSDPEIPGNDRNNFDFDFSHHVIGSEDSAFELMIDSLTEIINRSKDNSVKLLIESEGSLTNPGVSLLEKPSQYQKLFKIFGADIGINLNVAHSYFSSVFFQYDLKKFLAEVKDHIKACELSHNDKLNDLHLPFSKQSYILEFLGCLPDCPRILEFRRATKQQIIDSVELIRSLAD